MPVILRLFCATARRAAPKSSSTGRAVCAHDDVVGGDVAMQEVGRVQHLQRVEHGRDDGVELVLRRQPAELVQPVLEALPALEAHHHVGGGVGLEHARDAHDARMLEAGKRARFLQEVGAAPVEGLAVTLRPRAHVHGRVAVAEVEGVVFLDRDQGGEVDVLGLIGDAEPTGAHDPHDAVARVENGIDRQAKSAFQRDLLPGEALGKPTRRELGRPQSASELRAWPADLPRTTRSPDPIYPNPGMERIAQSCCQL